MLLLSCNSPTLPSSVEPESISWRSNRQKTTLGGADVKNPKSSIRFRGFFQFNRGILFYTKNICLESPLFPKEPSKIEPSQKRAIKQGESFVSLEIVSFVLRWFVSTSLKRVKGRIICQMFLFFKKTLLTLDIWACFFINLLCRVFLDMMWHLIPGIWNSTSLPLEFQIPST